MNELDFFQYINKNDSTVRDNVRTRLNNDMATILNDISLKYEVDNRYVELEEYLNKVFYPEKNGGNTAYSEQLMAMLRQIYQSETDKFIKSGIGDLEYEAMKSKPTFERSSNISKKQIKTLRETYIRIKEVFRKMEQSGNADELNELKKQANYNEIVKVINAVFKAYSDQSENNYVTANTAEKTGVVVKNGRSQRTLSGEKVMEAVNGLLSLEQTLERAGLIILQKDYGDFFEYALGLLTQDINITAEDVADTVAETIVKRFDRVKSGTLGAVKGGDKISRGVDAKITMTVTEDAAKAYEKKEQRVGDNVVTTWTAGNITLYHDPSKMTSKDVGSKRQGKVDVIITIPEVANGEPFRISAKNWKTIDDLRDLGSTSLLSGIGRTLSNINGKDEIDYYALAAQNPQEAYYNIVDELGKLCMFADIAMGYSQKEGYADTLVINDRAASHIYVRNIPFLIFEAMLENIKGLSYISASNSLVLKGYDFSEIQMLAMEARDIALRIHPNNNNDDDKKKRNTIITQDYLGQFKQKLNDIQIAVQVTGFNRK